MYAICIHIFCVCVCVRMVYDWLARSPLTITFDRRIYDRVLYNILRRSYVYCNTLRIYISTHAVGSRRCPDAELLRSTTQPTVVNVLSPAECRRRRVEIVGTIAGFWPMYRAILSTSTRGYVRMPRAHGCNRKTLTLFGLLYQHIPPGREKLKQSYYYQTLARIRYYTNYALRTSKCSGTRHFYCYILRIILPF